MKRMEKPIKDQIGSMKIKTIHATIPKKINKNKKKKIRIQKFMDVRVLMSTRTTTVSKNESFKISVSHDEFG